MGAPAGHPFFGNQFSSGDYVIGSYSYKDAISEVAEAVSKTVPAFHRAMPAVSKSFPDAVSRIKLQGFKPVGLQSPSIASLIAAGSVMLLGGVATYVYLRSRAIPAGGALPATADLAGFGVCESCGEELASSRPAEVSHDNDGDYLVCEHCDHKNRARFADDHD